MAKHRVTNKQLALSVDDLIGRQSVRATFKLPQEVIDLLNVIAAQLGIKKKSLFDQLIENRSVLEEVAREALYYRPAQTHRRQKTFVISRNTLQSLNHIAESKAVSRDILVELSIKRLLPIIEVELEKHNRRKELQKEMSDYLEQGKALLDKSANLLGKDDQLYRMMKDQHSMARRNLTTINKLVKQGMKMEEW